MGIEMTAQRATQRLLPLRHGIPIPTPVRRISTISSAAAVRSSSLIAQRPVLVGLSRSRIVSSSESALRPWTFSVGTRNGGVGLRRYYTKEESDVPNSRIYGFQEIKKLVETKDPEEKVVFIDVREPGELLETGKIPGAINIPITTAIQSFHISDQDFEDMYGFARPAKDANLVFYCRAGVRARSAAGLAQHAGWTNVGEYPGSWLDWEANQGPVEKI